MALAASCWQLRYAHAAVALPHLAKQVQAWHGAAPQTLTRSFAHLAHLGEVPEGMAEQLSGQDIMRPAFCIIDHLSFGLDACQQNPWRECYARSRLLDHVLYVTMTPVAGA